MHQPTTDHWALIKRLLRYLCGIINDGILLYCDSHLSLHAFSNVDWVGNKDEFSSASVYVVYLGRNSISWSSKKQRGVARSSTEVEYRSVATTAAELNLGLFSLDWTWCSTSSVSCDIL